MIVTKSLGILELPDSEINSSVSQSAINGIYFGKEKPVPIETKWPAIVSYGDFQKLKENGGPQSCTVAFDEQGEYLLLLTLEGSRVAPFTWNITHSTNGDAFTMDMGDTSASLISSLTFTDLYFKYEVQILALTNFRFAFNPFFYFLTLL